MKIFQGGAAALEAPCVAALMYAPAGESSAMIGVGAGAGAAGALGAACLATGVAGEKATGAEEVAAEDWVPLRRWHLIASGLKRVQEELLLAR